MCLRSNDHGGVLGHGGAANISYCASSGVHVSSGGRSVCFGCWKSVLQCKLSLRWPKMAFFFISILFHNSEFGILHFHTISQFRIRNTEFRIRNCEIVWK